MTELSVKKWLGILLILSHFAIILMIALLMAIGSLSSPDAKTSLAILIPVFSSFSTLIIKFFIDTRTQIVDDSKKVNGIFVFISYFIGLLFVFFISALIINQAYFRKQELADFTMLIGLSESVFGIYLGYIVKGLFETRTA